MTPRRVFCVLCGCMMVDCCLGLAEHEAEVGRRAAALRRRPIIGLPGLHLQPVRAHWNAPTDINMLSSFQILRKRDWASGRNDRKRCLVEQRLVWLLNVGIDLHSPSWCTLNNDRPADMVVSQWRSWRWSCMQLGCKVGRTCHGQHAAGEVHFSWSRLFT